MSGALPVPKPALSSSEKKKKKTHNKAGPSFSSTASPTSQSGNETFFSPESTSNNNDKTKNHVSAIRGGLLDATSSPTVAASSSSSAADSPHQTASNSRNKLDINVHLTSGWRAHISLWGGGGDSGTSPARGGGDWSETTAPASASSGQYDSPIRNESNDDENSDGNNENTENISLMGSWHTHTCPTNEDDDDDNGSDSVDDPFTVPGSIARATPEPIWG